MKQIFFFTALILICFKCSTNGSEVNASGTLTSLPAIWSVSTTDDGIISASGIVNTNVVYKNSILIGGRVKSGRAVQSVDFNTGKKNWIWQDYISTQGNTDMYSVQVDGNNLIWQQYSTNYSINLDNGITNWKNGLSIKYGDYVNLIGNNYYTGAAATSNLQLSLCGIYSFDKYNGIPNLIATPQFDTTALLINSGSSGMVEYVVPIINGIDTFLVACFRDPPSTNYTVRNSICCYNLSKKSWVYQRALIAPENHLGIEGTPFILNGNIYCTAGGGLQCNKLLSGENNWTKNFPSTSSFLFSGAIYGGGKIFANNENLHLYCIDPTNGSTVWDQSIFGTCSHMEYLNGVVYFVCGGDGKLYAIDAANGNKLWAVSSPDLKISSQASFDRYVGVVPPQNGQKGKIIVTTGLNAYCYEAYK